MLQYAVPKFPAANVQDAITFYVQKMGFTMIFDYGDYAAVRRDAVEIHLWECQDRVIAENTACRVAVDDIETLYAEFQRAGVIHPNGPLETKPWGAKEFVALDLDGNGIFFFEDIED